MCSKMDVRNEEIIEYMVTLRSNVFEVQATITVMTAGMGHLSTILGSLL